MKTKTFLQSVLGNDGFYCVFASRISDNKRIQKFYTDLGLVVDLAHNLDADGYDTYFALATFDTAASRKVNNVKQLNALFLDLDCGPSKDYADQPAAISALRAFCTTLTLPKPQVLSSGRGVHAYWPLTKPAELDVWLPVAEQLKAACAQHNLLADPVVTADAARVLRIPGTHNHKDSPPSPVEFLGRQAAASVDLDMFADLLGVPAIPVPTKHAPVSVETSAMMDALMGNKRNVFKDILAKTRRGVGCAQLSHLIRNQSEVDEPLWRAGLSITKFCEDGDIAAHKMSKDHEEYSQAETLKKLARIKGPYLCARFDEFNPGVCTDCPNFGKIKSPIVLGSSVKEATEEDNKVELPPLFGDLQAPPTSYTIPKFPAPYFRGVNGGVYKRYTDKEGEAAEKLVHIRDIYVTRRVNDPETGYNIVIRIHMPRDGVNEFTMAINEVTSRDKFREKMASKGAAAPANVTEELMHYILAWIQELEDSNVADEAHKQFGWSDDNCTSFIVGDQEVFADRTDYNPSSSHTAGLFPAFEPKGTLEEWKGLMEFYNRPGFELHQLVVGAGFGSPLMQLMPVKSAALHLHSKESGVGKTTAMAAATSIFGKPDDLIIHQSDTPNTKMHRGEVYKNLLLPMDELTNTPAKVLSDLAYQLVGGRQRNRMTSGGNAERYRGNPWRLLTITTGNTSIIEIIGGFKSIPKAEAQRILEVRVDRLFTKAIDKEEQDVFVQRLDKTYGTAGIPYIQYVMQNIEGVQKLLTDIQKRVDTAADLTSENRFWSAFITCSLVGLILAKRVGLVNYDPKAVFNLSVKILTQNKVQVDDMSISIEETLNDYIHEHWGNILWIKSTADNRRRGNAGLEDLVSPETQAKGKLVARYETDTKIAFLVPKPLKAWCSEQQINYQALVSDLIKYMGAKKTKIRIGKGTHMQLPATDVVAVKCNVKGAEEVSDVVAETGI